MNPPPILSKMMGGVPWCAARLYPGDGHARGGGRDRRLARATGAPRALRIGWFMLSVAVAGAGANESVSPWQSVLELDFAQAVLDLRESKDDQSRLALALAQLNLQPQTHQRRATAKAMLADLAQRSENRDVQAAAAYYRVRADDAFVVNPDYEAVAAAYEAVAAAFPDHFYGEFAVVKAMTLHLMVLRAGRDPLALAEVWYPRVKDLQAPALRRGALVTLATILIEHQQAFELAREWLEGARYRDYKRWDFRWRAQLRAIYLALKTEDRAGAQALVEDFTTRFPRSLRLQLLDDLVEGKVPVP